MFIRFHPTSRVVTCRFAPSVQRKHMHDYRSESCYIICFVHLFNIHAMWLLSVFVTMTLQNLFET